MTDIYRCPCKGHPFNCFDHPFDCGCHALSSQPVTVVMRTAQEEA